MSCIKILFVSATLAIFANQAYAQETYVKCEIWDAEKPGRPFPVKFKFGTSLFSQWSEENGWGENDCSSVGNTTASCTLDDDAFTLEKRTTVYGQFVSARTVKISRKTGRYQNDSIVGSQGHSQINGKCEKTPEPQITQNKF